MDYSPSAYRSIDRVRRPDQTRRPYCHGKPSFWLNLGQASIRLASFTTIQPDSGVIRRDCLDQVIVLNERHLRRILRLYLEYYHRSRRHLSLEGDSPEPRAVQGPDLGQVVELPEVGGLHHRYVREAA
jgi:hypothetical protein